MSGTMKDITGEQVKNAVLSQNIVNIPLRDCSLCGCMIGYHVAGSDLYLDTSCGCAWSPSNLASWEDPAKLINIQADPEHKRDIAAKFGVDIDNPGKYADIVVDYAQINSELILMLTESVILIEDLVQGKVISVDIAEFTAKARDLIIKGTVK